MVASKSTLMDVLCQIDFRLRFSMLWILRHVGQIRMGVPSVYFYLMM